MTVTQNVLSPEQHLQLRLLADSLDGSESAPGVFIEKTHAGVESRSAPHLDGVIAGIVKDLAQFDDLFGIHPGRKQRLLTVTY